MAGRYAYASLSRSLIGSARASCLRSSPPLPRLRPPPSSTPRLHRRRTLPRNFGGLGCTESFLPFGGVAVVPYLTAHLSAQALACCELSHGTFCRTCQDR